MTLDLETLYTSTAGFGVPATPTQRAILRAIEGRPLGELATHPEVVTSFGGAEAIAVLPSTAPLEFDLLAGIRTGKSQIAACRALHASQTVDVSGLSAGEVPRVSVLSLDLDKADVVLDHLVGTMLARPALKGLLLEPPSDRTVRVRHPSGRPIEIACVAGARAGAGVVARWSASAIFDEFARMFGSADGAVVNFDDARRAVLGRLLPGATILSIGSPWAPCGPAHERFLERHGKPAPDHVVVRVRADAMNPAWWTEARIQRLRASNDLAFSTDVEANFADPAETFILQSELRRVTRAESGDLPPCVRPRKYVCGVDPGTRGNAFTMVLLAASTDAEGVVRYEVAMAREWRGTSLSPLSPWATFAEIHRLIEPYGDPLVVTDQHSADAHVDICRRQGIRLHVWTITAQNRSTLFEALKGTLASGTISLPPDRTLLNDLSSVRRRLTPTGITYDLPRTSNGRHGDYVPALCLAIAAMGDSRQALAAAREAEASRRALYLGALIGGGTPTELSLLSPLARTEALMAMAHGASLESVLNPRANVLAAERDWRAGGGEERNAAAVEEQLRREGRLPPKPAPSVDEAAAQEQASLDALHERVQRRLSQGESE
jgi:hypothetical protein